VNFLLEVILFPGRAASWNHQDCNRQSMQRV